METITHPSKSLPFVIFLVLVRWRWELITATTTVVVYWNLTHPGGLYMEPVWAVLVMAAPFGLLALFGPSRRFLRNRFFCVATRHRVRSCLTEMRVRSQWSGNVPFIVACFSTKTGEVVWLWMRPGLSIEDLENKAEFMASACWARQALISRSTRNAALIRLDIDRRDPLAKKTITSPLLSDTSDLPQAQVADDALMAFISPDASEGTPTERPADSADRHTVTDTPGESRPKSKKTKTSAAVNDGETVVLGLNGEDVSDYV